MLPDIAIKKFPCKLRYNHSWPSGMPSIRGKESNKGMQGDGKWDARRRKMGFLKIGITVYFLSKTAKEKPG